MKIIEVSQRTGISTSTLRYYEKIGIINDKYISRTSSNYRKYRNEIIEYLFLVKAAKSVGFTLSEIVIIFKEKINSKKEILELLHRKQKEIKDQITELKRISKLVEYKISLFEK